MANRNWVSEKGGLEKGRVTLFLRIPTVTTGSVGTLATKKGITSVTRTGAGQYTIVLDDKYFQNLAVAVWPEGTGSTGTPAAGKATGGVAHSFTLGGSATNQFKITMLNGVTPADVDDGWTIVLEITFKDSTV